MTLLTKQVCPRCGRLAALLPWPYSRNKPRYIEEACRACIAFVRECLEQLEEIRRC